MMLRRHKFSVGVQNAPTELSEIVDQEIKIYSKRAFNGMSIEKILGIAKERNYVITATDKSEIVEQFLEFQGE